MAVFAISDLHLSFGTDKPMDVFGARWQDYETRLAENFRSTVKESDTVVCAGDFSWGMTLEEAKPDFAFLDALPGQKILLKGNHDYYWNTVSKLEHFLSENGFSTIRFLHNNAYVADGLILCGSRGWACEEKETASDSKIMAREVCRFQASLSAAKQLQALHPDAEIVAFSHYPVTSLAARTPIFDLLQQEGVKRVYYGHLHMVTENTKLLGEEDGVRLFLTSADYLNFQPLRIG